MAEVSLDWGASDSIFVEENMHTKPQLKSPEISKNDFTRVVTRSMISTPHVKPKRSPHHTKKQLKSLPVNSSQVQQSSSLPEKTDEYLQLSQWGLPDVIQSNYEAKGIKTLFPWQKECLLQEKVLDGGTF